jgi:hypothetical protein
MAEQFQNGTLVVAFAFGLDLLIASYLPLPPSHARCSVSQLQFKT